MESRIYYFILIILCILNQIRLQDAKFFHKKKTQSLRSGQDTCFYGYVWTGKKTCEICGHSETTPNTKIVGGVVASKNSWPAQTLIILSYKTDYNFGMYGMHTVSDRSLCGGTLINSATILTAAHCVTDISVQAFDGVWEIPVTLNKYHPTWGSIFKVYLGAHDTYFITSNTTAPLPTTEVPVKNIIIHPGYDANTFINDIALIILSTPVTTNAYIKYACLPERVSSTFPEAIRDAFASGWGALREGGSSPGVLYNVRLNIYGSSDCKNVFPGSPKNWNSQMCAGDLSGQKDTCQGDSGGGLYVKDDKINKYVVVGITSYGEGCAAVNKPGIYTRVSYYLDWIKSNWELKENVFVNLNTPKINSSRINNSCILVQFLLIIIISFKF